MAQKLYALPGDGQKIDLGFQPEDAVYTVVTLDESVIPGCTFSHSSWIRKECTRPGYIKFDTDVLLMFLGANPDDPEPLNATIDFYVENDKQTINENSFVFIPKGVAFGEFKVYDMKKPVYFYELHMTESEYKPIKAEPTILPDTYPRQYVQKYRPTSGNIPTGPEGFLSMLLWIDGAKLPHAPYMEAVWFHTTNDTGPSNHCHTFDEVIGFSGCDPDHPEDLQAEVHFVLGDETISVKQTCLFYIPRGIYHSPITVPAMDKSIFHFSGGNGGEYNGRDVSDLEGDN